MQEFCVRWSISALTKAEDLTKSQTVDFSADCVSSSDLSVNGFRDRSSDECLSETDLVCEKMDTHTQACFHNHQMSKPNLILRNMFYGVQHFASQHALTFGPWFKDTNIYKNKVTYSGSPCFTIITFCVTSMVFDFADLSILVSKPVRLHTAVTELFS